MLKLWCHHAQIDTAERASKRLGTIKIRWRSRYSPPLVEGAGGRASACYPRLASPIKGEELGDNVRRAMLALQLGHPEGVQDLLILQFDASVDDLIQWGR